MYDAIVVGARCGGAPTAMLLARKGYRVLLVDRAAFPSDIPHGHFIHRHGPRRLQAWGLLDRIVDRGTPAVTTMTSHFGDFALTGRELEVDGIALGYGPRRALLDEILVKAAVDAGVEFRDRFLVEEFATEDDAITGIRGRDTRGESTVAESARVTIGADGRHSVLARTVQAPAILSEPTITCWYFSYWSGVAAAGLEVHSHDRRVVFAFPTSGDRFAVFVAWPRDEFGSVRADIEGQFMRVIDGIPDLAGRIRAGHREEPFRGASELPNFVRKPYGPGWALVGDAGCHKDPFLALGICDAFRDADFLADALDDAWSGRRAMDSAMAAFETRRNDATIEDYHQNLRFARLQPPPAEVMGLRAAIRGDQQEIDHFCLANEGMIPREEFFNPGNLGRLMARAGAPA